MNELPKPAFVDNPIMAGAFASFMDWIWRQDDALSSLRAMRWALQEQARWIADARKLAPQLVVFPDTCWRSVADQEGFPTEGKVWVSDGERVWDVWSRGGIPPSATAVKFWLEGYQWPAPPSAERVADLSTEISTPRPSPAP